ncbi:MAG: hypothetical protein HC800_22115 [Phormidesmis sp. RL_2_1]|nr:hypothetical protein [Phormidesmis sp. RL_2_1]
MSRNQMHFWQYRFCLTLLTVLASAVFPMGFADAQVKSTTVFDLDRAICANSWGEAIGIAGRLMASDATTSAQRAALVALRQQLERYRAENMWVPDAQACDRTNPYLLDIADVPTVQATEPLGWEGALAEAAHTRNDAEIVTAAVPFSLPVTIGDRIGLTPATPVDLRNGLNVVSGHVGPGHNVYSFVAKRGDRLDANLQVTRVMRGALYTSDDSQLFIFDREGRLITSADDSPPHVNDIAADDITGEQTANEQANEQVNEQVSERPGTRQQSRISGMVVPKTDLYFAVVTSYNNDPIFDRQGHLTGWQDNGGGRFDYTLTFSGITPTDSLY